MSSHNKPFRVALCGVTGSGASEICRVLSERGYAHYDTDDRLRRMLIVERDLRQAMLDKVGPGCLDDLHRGTLRLRASAAADRATLGQYYDTLLPYIRRDIEQWDKLSWHARYAFYDVPFVDDRQHFDYVIKIESDFNVCLERVDGSAVDEADLLRLMCNEEYYIDLASPLIKQRASFLSPEKNAEMILRVLEVVTRIRKVCTTLT